MRWKERKFYLWVVKFGPILKINLEAFISTYWARGGYSVLLGTTLSQSLESGMLRSRTDEMKHKIPSHVWIPSHFLVQPSCLFYYFLTNSHRIRASRATFIWKITPTWVSSHFNYASFSHRSIWELIIAHSSHYNGNKRTRDIIQRRNPIAVWKPTQDLSPPTA